MLSAAVVRGWKAVKVWAPPAVLDGMIPRTFCWTTPEEKERERPQARDYRGEGRGVMERMLGEDEDRLDTSKEEATHSALR